MKFGLTEKEYQYIKETVVLPLQKRGATIWCFGSRARGNHQPFSDLDLMIESLSDLSREIGLITEKLEEGHFPYKVDIVQEKDFAKSYMPNFLKERVSFI